MNLHQVECGDVVVLKSGGPKMTVGQPANQNEKVVPCQWFINGLVQHGYFYPDQLRKVIGDE